MTPGELEVWRAVYAAEWVRLAAIQRMTGSGRNIAAEAAVSATAAVHELRDLARRAGDASYAAEALR